jgi:hypothetical protein
MSCFDRVEMPRYDINGKRVALHGCTREAICVVCEFPYGVYKQEVCLWRSALPYLDPEGPRRGVSPIIIAQRLT